MPRSSFGRTATCCESWLGNLHEPTWVVESVVRAIHGRLLAEHGGAAGIRDSGLLTSALARPQQIWAYSEEKPSIQRLAAAYAVSLVRNHAFVDGNKRVALIVTLLFLDLNERDLAATQEEKYVVMMRLAANDLAESELISWLEERCRTRRT